ncbi:hypothetical protein [Piscinibacter gummiphilus]|uniref:DUF1351 domain-containing protein n=1 Tax=Piscinibacter gummiphilus TaxID=946333 RepID=A0ABZ0CNT4_9BURK|nr:hypothetical protein [Piscinibacter gummiphilus]WOB06549.1 hypothetical protein RXV79_16640 [Piscinibacter gummiphilus]
MTTDTQEAPSGAPEVADELVDAAPKSNAVALFDPLQKIKAGLDQLKADHEAADWDIETTAGDDAARKFRKRCVSIRASADAVYEQCNQPLLKAQRDARALRDEIKAFVEPIELAWDAKIVAKEQRKAAEKKAREEAEVARVKAIRATIASFGELVVSVAAASASKVSDALDSIVGRQIAEEEFAEFIDEAVASWTKAVRDLQSLLQAAEEREAEARRLEEQREQLRLAEEAAERERQAAAKRATERSHMLGLITMAAVSAVGKSSEHISAAITGLEQYRPVTDAFADADVSDALERTISQLEAMRQSTAESERLRAEYNERVRRQNEEAAEQFKKLQKQKDDQAAEAVELKRQQDAFEAERLAAIEQANAQKAEVKEGAAAELDALEAAAPAPEPEAPAAQVDAANEPAAEPLVEQPPPADDQPAVAPARRPAEAQIVAVLANAFNATEEDVITWIATFNIAYKEIAA